VADDDPKSTAQEMAQALDLLTQPSGHIGKVRRYLRGKHDLPYIPKGATDEFIELARRSITNWLPLISSTFVKNLFVDGYRTGRSAEMAPAWRYWQANQMDARQSITMHGVVDYGVAHVLVGKGNPTPVIKPLSPQRSLAWYEDDDDDYPIAAIYRAGVTLSGEHAFDFYMGAYRYRYVRQGPRPLDGMPNDPYNPFDGRDNEWKFGELQLRSITPHGMGNFVPWVRFRERLDDESTGVVRPLITVQDRINNTVFDLLMALQYASFRQRWATGLAIPRDQDEKLPDGTDNPNFGKPIQPFEAAVNRLWVSENSETKFGDFAQTDVAGHLSAYDSAVRTLVSIAESSPLILVGDLSNIAVEAFATLNDSMNKKVAEIKTLCGESWERVFALASMAAGESYDETAQVKWRDTEPRSFAQIVDGLSKLYNIGAPSEGLFELVPGLTDQDIQRWVELKQRPTDTDRLADAIRRTAVPAV